MIGNKPNVPRNKFSTQQTVVWSDVELQRNKHIDLCNEKGEIILSYKLPRSIDHAGVLISSPLLHKNETYTLSTNDATASNNHIGNGLYTGGTSSATEDVQKFSFTTLITKIDSKGEVEAISVDTMDISKGMMPPPFGMGGGPGITPPPFDPNNIPDSIKKRFPFPADGKMPFPPPFEGMRGKDEGYNATNLPGGGW